MKKMFKQTANDVWHLNYEKLGEELRLETAHKTIETLAFDVRLMARKDLWMAVDMVVYGQVRNTIVSNI